MMKNTINVELVLCLMCPLVWCTCDRHSSDINVIKLLDLVVILFMRHIESFQFGSSAFTDSFINVSFGDYAKKFQFPEF